jgi:hypothetical protein
MYLEEKLKAEIVAEGLEKSTKAILQTGDGHQSGSKKRITPSSRLRGLSNQRAVLPV